MTNVEESWANLRAELRQVVERGSKDPNYFLTIRRLIVQIPKLILYDDTPEPGVNLAHYTAWKNARDMFNVDREPPILRMYNYEQANDPEEGRIKPPEWKKVEEDAAYLAKFLKQDSRWTEEMSLVGSTYGCSFSSGLSGAVEDDLTYWRLYGNDGQGCSLKIPTTDIMGADRARMGVYKVHYRDRDFISRSDCEKKEDEQVATHLKIFLEVCKEAVDAAPEVHKDIVGRTVAEGLHQIIYGYYHLIKNIAYADENEWRILRVKPRSNAIRYDTRSDYLVRRYVEGPALKDLLISGSAITIGPAVLNRIAARAYFKHLAKRHKLKLVDVRISNKAYRQAPYLAPMTVSRSVS